MGALVTCNLNCYLQTKKSYVNSQANNYMFSESDSGVSLNDGNRGVHRGGHLDGQSWRIIAMVIMGNHRGGNRDN